MPETRPPITLKGLSLAELETAIAERRLPPVDKWNPPHCGHSGMRIARDGTWYHEGSAIRRPAMVRLFASVLRREPDGRHMLVTPVEKLDIDVEATAFRASAMNSQGSGRERRVVLPGHHPDSSCRSISTPFGHHRRSQQTSPTSQGYFSETCTYVLQHDHRSMELHKQSHSTGERLVAQSGRRLSTLG